MVDRAASTSAKVGSSVTTSVLNYCAVLAFMCITQAFQKHFMGHGCSMCVYNYGSWPAGKQLMVLQRIMHLTNNNTHANYRVPDIALI